MSAPPPVTATGVLERAAEHMRDRAERYDTPGGERSARATVEAFNAVTGHTLTTEEGWVFMVLLKVVRSQAGAFHLDCYEDMAAFAALAGEQAAEDRGDA